MTKSKIVQADIMQKSLLGSVRAITFKMYGTLMDCVARFASGFGGFSKCKGYLGSAYDVVRAREATSLPESNVDSMLGRARNSVEVVRTVILSELFFKLKIDHTKYDIEQLANVNPYRHYFPT